MGVLCRGCARAPRGQAFLLPAQHAGEQHIKCSCSIMRTLYVFYTGEKRHSLAVVCPAPSQGP